MGINPASKPLINGVLYEALSSVEAAIAGKERYITAINYADSVERKDITGNSALRIGQVINKYKVDTCDFEMPLADAMALIADIGNGFGKVKFTIVVRYSVDGETTITDVIEEVSINKPETMHSDGDAVKRKFTCSAYRIKWNGYYLLT